MAGDVREQLLEDAEERGRAIPVRVVELSGDVQRAAHAGAPLELARLPLDGCREADLVENLGPEPRGDAAHRIDDAIDRGREPARFLGALEGRGIPTGRHERLDVELESGER